MLTIQQLEEKENQMAHDHFPKHGFSAPDCDGRKMPKHCFRRAARPRRVAMVTGRVSILITAPFQKTLCRLILLSFLLGCVGMSVFAAVNTETPPFAASGTITTKAFRAGEESPHYQAEFTFTFASSNDWWEVEVVRLNAGQGEGEIENCRVVPGGVRNYVLFKGRTNDGALDVATVCPIPFPPPTSPSMFVAWLSFCPVPHLPTIDAKRMHRFLEDITSCSGTLDLMADPRNEGKYSVAYLNPEELFLKQLKVWNGGVAIITGNDNQPQFRNFSGAFENGFLDSEFEATESTNLHGITFPLRTIYQHYAPNWATETNDDLYRSVYSELIVSQLSFGTHELRNGNAKPVEMFAFDLRPDKFPVRYLVRNDQWKPVTDPQIQTLVRLARQSKEATRTKSTSETRTAVRFFFGLVTAVPIVIFLVRAYKKTKMKNQKTNP